MTEPSAPAHSGVTGKLTDKVGPLPLWAWGVLTVVGILAWEAFAKKTAPAPVATPTDAPVDTTGDVSAPNETGWGNTAGTGGLYALQAWFAYQEAQHAQSGGPKRHPNVAQWLQHHPRAEKRIEQRLHSPAVTKNPPQLSPEERAKLRQRAWSSISPAERRRVLKVTTIAHPGVTQ